MKNILLGYFHTPENKRSEVVRVLGHLVGFSQDEIDEVFASFLPSFVLPDVFCFSYALPVI